MKKTGTILILLHFCFVPLIAQRHPAKNDCVRHYTQQQVIDSTEGIRLYHTMMKVLAMDYDVLSKNGSQVKGWNEEYYDNGQLKHVSYYKDNKLVLFKNYFENGQCEHNIAYTDSNTCSIDVYFESGGLKFQIYFYKGLPKKITEFFASGLPKCNIEYDTDLLCVSSKRTWFLNAEIQTELQLTDAKAKKYSDKVFYPNGQLKEEGELLYLEGSREYIKCGTWHCLESSGKKKSSEKYKVKLNSN